MLNILKEVWSLNHLKINDSDQRWFVKRDSRPRLTSVWRCVFTFTAVHSSDYRCTVFSSDMYCSSLSMHTGLFPCNLFSSPALHKLLLISVACQSFDLQLVSVQNLILLNCMCSFQCNISQQESSCFFYLSSVLIFLNWKMQTTINWPDNNLLSHLDAIL